MSDPVLAMFPMVVNVDKVVENNEGLVLSVRSGSKSTEGLVRLGTKILRVCRTGKPPI